MAIIKVLKRENPYVQIDKIGVDDSNLSWEATGLLTYLIGRPNNWKINIAHLASVKKNKETSTRNALLELRKAKYCHYFEIRKSGKIVETFYLVFETPTEYEEIKSNIGIELKEGEKIFYKSLSQKKKINDSDTQPEVENQQSAKNMENTLPLPKVEKPKTEKPKVENQALINIDIKNNRMNIKKNHEYDFEENDDNLRRIEELFKEFGIDNIFVQDNHSKSLKGVLRGLHFQKEDYSQAKLISVLKGSILDIVVDLRKNSKTFGKYFAMEINENNKKMLFIPKGFAHGFLTLEDGTEIFYKCDNFYNPQSEGGIIWNDRDLNIDWNFKKYNINENELIISEKDKKNKSFKEYKKINSIE